MARRAITRRRTAAPAPQSAAEYLAAPDGEVDFFGSGCKVLDLALGGGWASPRTINVVGDRSTGKTLLAIEASANFAVQFPQGKIRYREREAAFQKNYAQTLGLPLDRVDFGEQPIETVDDLYEEIEYRVGHATQPELFIVDSLDALSSREEMKRSIDKGSYGAEKPKLISRLFREFNAKMVDRGITLFLISQIRDNMNPQSWRGWTRTGGKALDFYASQVVYLAPMGKVPREVNGIKRNVGITIKALIDKNKVAAPYREITFDILFGYGMDDTKACIEFLKKNGGLGPENEALSCMKETSFRNMVLHHTDEQSPGRAECIEHLRQYTEQRWHEIEQSFLPRRAKYA